MSIDEILEGVIGKEGGYSNHSSDLGGATRWGVTEKVARANGYTGDMKVFPRETAKAIYLKQYFLQPRINLIFDVSQRIAEEMVDSNINLGTKWPALWLQQSLNLLSNNGKDYKQITEDGIIGSGTVNALKSLMAKRGVTGEMIILKMLNVLQGARYIEITRARPANAAFLAGWFAHRVEI